MSQKSQTLIAVAEAKEKLKVAQMPETFSKYNTAKITSVKLESIAHPHSTSQNLRPGTSYFIPKVRIICSKGILLKNTPI